MKLSAMEGEISPDRQLWTNPWFLKPGTHANDLDDSGLSLLEGRQMGFYGPWVVDANHDSKSEIHPVSMIWWKEHFDPGWGSPQPFLCLRPDGKLQGFVTLGSQVGRNDDEEGFHVLPQARAASRSGARVTVTDAHRQPGTFEARFRTP